MNPDMMKAAALSKNGIDDADTMNMLFRHIFNMIWMPTKMA